MYEQKEDDDDQEDSLKNYWQKEPEQIPIKNWSGIPVAKQEQW